MIDTFIKRRIKEPTIDVQVATWGSVLKRTEKMAFWKRFSWGVHSVFFKNELKTLETEFYGKKNVEGVKRTIKSKGGQ